MFSTRRGPLSPGGASSPYLPPLGVVPVARPPRHDWMVWGALSVVAVGAYLLYPSPGASAPRQVSALNRGGGLFLTGETHHSFEVSAANLAVPTEPTSRVTLAFKPPPAFARACAANKGCFATGAEVVVGNAAYLTGASLFACRDRRGRKTSGTATFVPST